MESPELPATEDSCDSISLLFEVVESVEKGVEATKVLRVLLVGERVQQAWELWSREALGRAGVRGKERGK